MPSSLSVPSAGGQAGHPAGLIRWGHAAARRGRLPVLWLFTDTRRLPDPCPAARRLPKGISGIVFRHDDHPDRAVIGRALAAICRDRRIALVVAGDPELAAALGAGEHLRGGRRDAHHRPRWPVTSSAHGFADLVSARRARADLVFLSPAFATASHPGAPSLGAVRWAGLARRAGGAVAALGGMDGFSARRLPRRYLGGVGAIGAFT